MTTKSTILKITLLNVSSEYPIIAFSKNTILVWEEMPDFREGQVEKYGRNIFPGRLRGNCFNFTLEE